MDILKYCAITVRSGSLDIDDIQCKYVSSDNGIIKCIDSKGREILIRANDEDDGFVAFKIGNEELKRGKEIGYPLDDDGFKKLYKHVRIKLKDIKVSEYGEGYPIGIGIKKGKLCLIGTNEGGFNSVSIDIEDIINFIDGYRDSIYKLKNFIETSLNINQKDKKYRKKKK